MANSENDFEVPKNMLEATPTDVQGVLDAIDTLLIDAANQKPREVADVGSVSLSGFPISEDFAQRVLKDMARRQHLTPEQLLEQLNDMQLHELHPVDGMEAFQVRRFTESYHGTLGMVIRRFSDEQGGISVAHIHETKRGLKLNFGYDVPGVPRASVADCEKIKAQLGRTWIL